MQESRPLHTWRAKPSLEYLKYQTDIHWESPALLWLYKPADEPNSSSMV